MHGLAQGAENENVVPSAKPPRNPKGGMDSLSKVYKHSYKTKTRESMPVAVYNSGSQQCEPGYAWGPAVRDHFLIHHILLGKGTYRVGNQQFHLEQGDTFLVYPGQVVQYQADQQNPWAYCWVGFNGAEAKLVMSQTPFSREHPILRSQHPAKLAESITAIYQALGTTQAAEMRAIGYLYQFLALLMEEAPGTPANRDLSLEYVEAAIRYISHNYSRPIDISDVASSVGISRSHLYRVFMRHIGTPPNEYLTHYRVSQACDLLEHTSLPIFAAAASVGYEDQLYFSRVFKKVMGVPPSEYLKSHRQKNSERSL